jgi:carbamoyl-phosphate synthase small subunit
MNTAHLRLENGAVFQGESPAWQSGIFPGEVVFTTGMTGYEASLTDTSYAGQIIVFTYPLMGNYGVLEEKRWESGKIYASGVIVSQMCSQWSHAQSLHSLEAWLETEQIPLIVGIDTRKLTQVLREAGTMAGMIICGNADGNPVSNLPLVSINEPIAYEAQGKRIIAVDCGMKASILRNLQVRGLAIKRVPWDYDYSSEDFDGILLSNGPGNPENYSKTITHLQKAIARQKPIFGICLGAQLLALASGAKTYKLPYGHRGHNQPCIELGTKRCFITSQNHGYAIQENSLPKDWSLYFKNLNDGTVEGIQHLAKPFFAVQFHPEASPGPTDTEWLFDKFVEML